MQEPPAATTISRADPPRARRDAGGTAALCEVPFAAAYVYSPDAHTEASRLLRVRVKSGDVKSLVDQASHPCASFFPAAAILVPLPGRTPSARGPSPATERLAAALWEQGLGHAIWFGLRRARPVRKSATAAPGARPSVKMHYDTLAVEAIDIPPACRIVLVDDVVTKGRTLWAAALRMHEVLPLADIRAFALLRTRGYASSVAPLLSPCMGTIAWKGGDVHRNP